MIMTGETIDEMMDALKLNFKAVEARLWRAKIKPISRRALYPIGTTKIIEKMDAVGWPKGKPRKQKEDKDKK